MVTESVFFIKKKDKPKEKWWLVDFSFFIYSGSFAMKRDCKCKNNQACKICNGSGKVYMQTSTGVITGGLYTIVSQILYAKRNGYKIMMAFDPPKEQLTRTKLLDTYKGNRPAIPEWIQTQKVLGKNIFPLTSIPCYSSHEDESDDILATFAIKKALEGHDVVLASDDKDFFPLLEYSNLKLYRKRQFFSKRDFEQTFKFPVKRFSEYLAIVGDSADNFNLLHGLGPVAAEYIINNTKTSCLEIFDKLDEIPEKYKKKLLKFEDGKIIGNLKEELKLSLQLANLNTNSEYFTINKTIDKKEVLDFLNYLEFFSFTNDIELFVT